MLLLNKQFSNNKEPVWSIKLIALIENPLKLQFEVP